jgi:hypothetical protein
MQTTEIPHTNGAATNGAMIPAPQAEESISAFASAANFEAAQRMAKSLASSTLMPAAYQGNIPNVLIAMEIASRIGASVFMVAQSLDIIHGRPSWSAKFLIATVNASGRFTPLRYRWQGKEGSDDWGCRAVAKDRSDGEECVGPLVTIGTAKAEGWYAKNGSKWRTLAELMILYRAATFWTRVYCPELGLGMQTAEEVFDTTGHTVSTSVSALVPTIAPAVGSAAELETALLEAHPDPKKGRTKKALDVPHDPVTGEVLLVASNTREPGEEG